MLLISSTPNRILTFLLLVFSSLHIIPALSCNQLDRDSLSAFYHHISFPATAPLNWSASTDCCQWEGITCGRENGRVNRLWLPARGLSGTITSFLGNLSSLSHLNLSRNRFFGPLPPKLFQNLTNLQTLDLSYNFISGSLQPPQSSDGLPGSVQTVDLSSNSFYGPLDPSFLHLASNLIGFNISNNTFTGPIPTSICITSPLLEVLDFSNNKFSDHIFHGIGKCSNLQVLRAGHNSLWGWLPYDLYSVITLEELSLPGNRFSGPINSSITLLSSLTILELHDNELVGELPPDIGLLSNLEVLLLHTNSLNGTLPPSLMDCTNLTTLLVRNNHLGGQISSLEFSKLNQIQAIDLGNNSFVGNIPASLCLCKSLTALRLAYNRFNGELPPCFAGLRSLQHLSLSDNYLSNVAGALRTLIHNDNLSVLFLSRCFKDEIMPDDSSLPQLNGFQNLQILTLGGGNLEGRIPSWIAKLRKLKVFNLSNNRISGRLPSWLGSMPNLFVLNLTQNALSGDLPQEIGSLPALIADETDTDLSNLALPFLFDSQQYNRLFNLPRGVKLGNNNLSGNIPPEIGKLRLLHILDLGNNHFEGKIPDELSRLINLERLDLSGNNLSGEIPESLTALHFLSSFSVANNDLEGEVPRGGQLDTFPAASFAGNPKLCGSLLRKSCSVMITQTDTREDDESEDSWFGVPFGMGYFVGFFAVSISLLFCSPWRCVGRSDSTEVNVNRCSLFV